MLLSAAPAHAQSFDAAKAFGAREDVEQASLSPDGTKLAYVSPTAGQGSAVFVVPIVKGAVPGMIVQADGRPERISGCRWTTNTRLLCTVYAIQIVEDAIVYASRLVALNDDGSGMATIREDRGSGDQIGPGLYGGSVIDWNPGEEGEVLMMRQYVPETSTGTLMAQKKRGIGVDVIDTMTLKSRNVERPDEEAAEFLTDGRGTVRIMSRVEYKGGYSTGVRRYLFRRKNSRNWELLSEVDENRGGFDPYGIDPTLDIAYGLKRHQGRLAAFSKALDGSGTEKLVFAHPEVDVTGFKRIGRNGRIIGVSYATDVRAVHYFDPAIAAMVRTLGKALPSLPMINVIDSSEDETRMLIWAGSDVDPGRYYLFDRTAKRLSELLPTRPALKGVALAQMRAVTYPAADGTMVPAYLTLPPDGGKKLPAIVLPHGGPEARDEWGFDWLSQFFANRGFAVLQPNFRGSAGYGDAWLRKNGFQSWRTAIGDVNDAGRWLVKQGIADPDRLNIVGWSYGGYAALQSAVLEPGLFKRVIAIAPVTDLGKLSDQANRYASARVVQRFIGSGPHIEEGSPARHADKIKVPVLMFHGDLDRNANVDHAELMDARLKATGGQSELIVFENLDHYLEDSAAREEMLRKSAVFLGGK